MCSKRALEATLPESKKRRPKAASTVEDRERIIRKRLLPRFGEKDALKIKPSEIKGLESVQDEEDLENPTVDKIRRVMHLVCSMAQTNDLIPRTAEANPVTHVHIATTTQYEAILVTPQQAWNVINRMDAFERLLTLCADVRLVGVEMFKRSARPGIPSSRAKGIKFG